MSFRVLWGVDPTGSTYNPDLFLSDATLGIPSLLDTLHTDSKSARDFLPAVFTNR